MTILLMFLASLLSASYPGNDWFPVTIEGPLYPALATQAQVTGTVKLRVVLDEQGRVALAEVISGPRLLARAAQENLKAWVFAACRPIDQRTAPVTIDFTYVFMLQGQPSARPRTRFRYEHPYRVTLIAEPQHWMPSKSLD